MCERCQSGIALCFKKRDVANQSDAFQPALCIAAAIKSTAIEGTNQAVVVYPARHDERMYGTLGKKIQDLSLVPIVELMNRLVADRRQRRSGVWRDV